MPREVPVYSFVQLSSFLRNALRGAANCGHHFRVEWMADRAQRIFDGLHPPPPEAPIFRYGGNDHSALVRIDAGQFHDLSR